jgi:hypothetical protein
MNIGKAFLVYFAVGVPLVMMGVPDGAAVGIAGIAFIAALVVMAAKGERGGKSGGPASKPPSSGNSCGSYATMSEKQRRKEDDEQFEVLLSTWQMEEWGDL